MSKYYYYTPRNIESLQKRFPKKGWMFPCYFCRIITMRYKYYNICTNNIRVPCCNSCSNKKIYYLFPKYILKL